MSQAESSSGGTFNLTYSGTPTTAIPYEPTPEELKQVIQAANAYLSANPFLHED